MKKKPAKKQGIITNPKIFLSFPKSYYEKYVKFVITQISHNFPEATLRNYKEPQYSIGESERESDRKLQEEADIGVFFWGADFKKSRNCQRELDNFYSRETRGEARVLIINVDDTERPSELTGKNHVDFSAKSFTERLILSLKNIIELTYSQSIRKSQIRNLNKTTTKPVKLSPARSSRLNPGFQRATASTAAKTREWGVIRRSDDRDSQIKEIAQGRVGTVQAKLLYSSYYGAQAWSHNCQRPSYLFYWNSAKELNLRISEVVDRAILASRDPEFDLISIGCGNGIKDESVLTAMLSKLNPDTKQNQFIYYYPFDISPYLLSQAEDAVLSPNSAATQAVQEGRLKIKGILGDLKYLKDGDEIYEEYTGNNIFSILGNTIGNEGEQEVIRSLIEAILPGDFVIIEYNADIYGKSYSDHFCQNENIRRHWESFANLVPGVSHTNLGWETISKNRKSTNYHPSASPFAERSIMTYADNVKFPNHLAKHPLRRLGLAILHSYSKEGMDSAISNMGLEVIYNDVALDVGLLLARKTLQTQEPN